MSKQGYLSFKLVSLTPRNGLQLHSRVLRIFPLLYGWKAEESLMSFNTASVWHCLAIQIHFKARGFK